MTATKTDSGSTDGTSSKPDRTRANHLRTHRLIVTALYALSWAITYNVLSMDEARSSLIVFLSSSAIFATLGAAISAIGSIFERDLLERVMLNVNILFTDIIKQTAHWRRWPFLPRMDKRKLLNGDVHELQLTNPQIPIDVGTHVIKLDLPTVLDDFFDLPLLRNVWLVIRFRGAAHTGVSRLPRGVVNTNTGLTGSDEYMAYECLFDTWICVFKFRIARYATHFGSALTISAVIVVALYLLQRGG